MSSEKDRLKENEEVMYHQDDELRTILEDDIKAELRGENEDNLSVGLGKTAEEINEEIEMRELAKLERELDAARYKESKLDVFKEYSVELFNIVPAIQSVIYFFIFYFASAIYVNILSANIIIALVVSIPISLLIFHYFVYVPAKLNRYQNNLQNLNSYANSMVFYMGAGDNIYNALVKTKRSVRGDVKVDIQRTINKLDTNALELDTSSFNRYRFRNIDIFNQMLLIRYIEGGSDVKAMFNNILKFISFEIIKRDELYRNKRQMRATIMMMIAMGLSIPLIIALMAKQQYEMFLANPLAQYMIVIYVLLLVWNLCSSQKATCDIDLD